MVCVPNILFSILVPSLFHLFNFEIYQLFKEILIYTNTYTYIYIYAQYRIALNVWPSPFMSYKHSVVFISQPLLNLFNFERLLITEYDQAKSTQSTETEETVSLLDYRY